MVDHSIYSSYYFLNYGEFLKCQSHSNISTKCFAKANGLTVFSISSHLWVGIILIYPQLTD